MGERRTQRLRPSIRCPTRGYDPEYYGNSPESGEEKLTTENCPSPAEHQLGGRGASNVVYRLGQELFTYYSLNW